MRQTIAIIAAGLLTCYLSSGCLNLGGGRQLVTLPWSYPAVAMDATGTQTKNGKAAGAQFTGSGPAIPATGDQVMTIGANQSNQRSTDASLADEQSQAVGQQSPGSAIDSSQGKTLDKRATPTVNVGPAGGAQLGTGTAGGATPAATTVDPAALTDAQAAALLERLRKAQSAVDAAAATPAAR